MSTPSRVMHRFSVGRLNCIVVSDGQPPPPWEPPLDSFFTPASGVPAAELAAAVAAEGARRTTLTGGYNCLLVETSAGLAVIDTGLGARFLGYGPAIGGQVGRLAEHLIEAGLSASDLAAVVFTHLHQDHVPPSWRRPLPSTCRLRARRSRCSVNSFARSSTGPRSCLECAPWTPLAIPQATPQSCWSRLVSGCYAWVTRSTTVCSCAIPAGPRPGITTVRGRPRAAADCWRGRLTRTSPYTPTTCHSPASARSGGTVTRSSGAQKCQTLSIA